MSVQNLKLNVWFPTYLRCLYIMSQTYKSTYETPDPDGKRPTDQEITYAFKCFITSMINTMPDSFTKEKIQSFLFMTNYASDLLLKEPSLQSFFNIYSYMKDEVKKGTSMFYNNTAFLDYCLQSEFTMTCWVYLLQSYMIIVTNKYGGYTGIPKFTDITTEYNIKRITKDDWGNAIWFIIHVSAMWGSGDMEELFYNYKAMLSCLQYLLPCPKCRAHLRNNLSKIDIDYCRMSRDALFECSWRLHNIVNQDLGKPQPTLQSARAMYQF